MFGDLIHRLGALGVLPEDPCLIQQHIIAYNTVPRAPTSTSGLRHCIHVLHRHTCRYNAHTHKNNETLEMLAIGILVDNIHGEQSLKEISNSTVDFLL